MLKSIAVSTHNNPSSSFDWGWCSRWHLGCLGFFLPTGRERCSAVATLGQLPSLHWKWLRWYRSQRFQGPLRRECRRSVPRSRGDQWGVEVLGWWHHNELINWNTTAAKQRSAVPKRKHLAVNSGKSNSDEKPNSNLRSEDQGCYASTLDVICFSWTFTNEPALNPHWSVAGGELTTSPFQHGQSAGCLSRTWVAPTLVEHLGWWPGTKSGTRCAEQNRWHLALHVSNTARPFAEMVSVPYGRCLHASRSPIELSRAR